MAQAALIRSVPFYPQEAYQCGPASLAMALNHRSAGVTLDETVDRVYLPGRQGSLQVEMVATARSEGLLVYPLDGDLKAIIREVDAGNPVLVFQNLRLGWWPQWHFAVVIGYDLEQQELVLHSGTQKQTTLPFRVFDNTWAKADRWARVVMPPGQLPATAEPVTYVRAAHDLEEVGQAEAARDSYRAALEAWPDSLAAGFAHANLLLSRQQWQQAEDAFRQLLAFHPRSAPAWHNLGVALEHNQCPVAARQARRCAGGLAPDDARFDTVPEASGAEVSASCSVTSLLTEAGCTVPE
ncbi:PA2778 family cysteine peptidase [Marinobacter zhanjiangensis]|uniref:PA2778 family cysteine peptidase n=1 Tax=Marinobacter zhanjiangensis TaxID=578215 RepID=UPI001D100EC4|nr:PA2778 family cysteine peptidase [Marinobacter zhanjiangensis]